MAKLRASLDVVVRLVRKEMGEILGYPPAEHWYKTSDWNWLFIGYMKDNQKWKDENIGAGIRFVDSGSSLGSDTEVQYYTSPYTNPSQTEANYEVATKFAWERLVKLGAIVPGG